MNGSPAGLTPLEQRLIRHEGIVLKPYRDTMGYWSIGVGQKISQAMALGQYKDGITRAEALQLMNAAIANARHRLAAVLPWTTSLSPTKQDVLVEMVYQLGMQGLLGFSNFLLYAHEGNDAAAAREMLDSAWHRQTPARCEELAKLWMANELTAKS